MLDKNPVFVHVYLPADVQPEYNEVKQMLANGGYGKLIFGGYMLLGEVKLDPFPEGDKVPLAAVKVSRVTDENKAVLIASIL